MFVYVLVKRRKAPPGPTAIEPVCTRHQVKTTLVHPNALFSVGEDHLKLSEKCHQTRVSLSTKWKNLGLYVSGIGASLIIFALNPVAAGYGNA